MSLHDYQEAIGIRGVGFNALIMVAIKKADSGNAELLKEAFPDIWTEFHLRYHAPNGLLEGEREDSP